MVLQTTYFGSVDWYRLIARTDEPVYIEAHERFIKQTPRNHCMIATANGVQKLSVPVSAPSASIQEVLISDHGNWRHQHWEALKSAYGMSPFFEFYADDIQPFFTERWETLFEFNLDIMRKMTDFIGIDKEILVTSSRQKPLITSTPAAYTAADGRNDAECGYRYYQTFQRRHGFIPGLSILDLLFNEGPESIKVLLQPEKG